MVYTVYMTPIFKKSLATAILLIPSVFLLMFVVGEMTAGSITDGASHLIQLAPIIILLLLGWKYPRAVGYILITGAIILGIMYAVNNPFPLVTIVVVETILFLPLVIAGILFIKSRKKEPENQDEPKEDQE